MTSSYVMRRQPASLVCSQQTSLYLYISHLYLACIGRLDFLCNTNTTVSSKATLTLNDRLTSVSNKPLRTSMSLTRTIAESHSTYIDIEPCSIDTCESPN